MKGRELSNWRFCRFQQHEKQETSSANDESDRKKSFSSWFECCINDVHFMVWSRSTWISRWHSRVHRKEWSIIRREWHFLFQHLTKWHDGLRIKLSSHVQENTLPTGPKSHRNLRGSFLFISKRDFFLLVRSRDESATTGDEIYRLSDGRVIHHQSRMFIVPPIYYQQDRTLFRFFNMEYLEADGYFILRIIATNAR